MEHDSVQAIRLITRNGRLSTSISSSSSEADILYITCHPDPSLGKDIILWDDIVAAFKDPLHIRNGAKIIPFLKGADFKKYSTKYTHYCVLYTGGCQTFFFVVTSVNTLVTTPLNSLDPLRIAAVPNVVLGVVVEGPLIAAETALPPAYDTLDMSSLTITTQTTSNAQQGLTNTGDTIKPGIGIFVTTDEIKRYITKGSQYRDGEGVAKDFSKALEWYSKAAEQGSAIAMDHIGYLYNIGGPSFPIDAAQALEWYLKAANKGNRSAQGSIGELYQNGKGVPQNYQKAAEWFLKAANLGDPWSQRQLGVLYKNGQGVEQDHAKALLWFHKAADHGYAPAQYSIGLQYNNGHGVSQDLNEALEWYLKAADQGHFAAQDSIGYLYHVGGPGFAVNYAKAMEWYMKAATRGYASAQSSVGELYKFGRGVPQDYQKAMEWFLRAAGQDYSWAQNIIGDMYRD
ncbi:hypothetical protein BGZ97_005735, partial [Linnemannia gamsii]